MLKKNIAASALCFLFALCLVSCEKTSKKEAKVPEAKIKSEPASTENEEDVIAEAKKEAEEGELIRESIDAEKKPDITEEGTKNDDKAKKNSRKKSVMNFFQKMRRSRTSGKRQASKRHKASHEEQSSEDHEALPEDSH
ncbi:MAG: hypothetical protein LBC04_02360 [Holosporaceae bacterium]|jgi:hypothetical protein|nr:hypothetical protein [Holosporaceae bacterium]